MIEGGLESSDTQSETQQVVETQRGAQLLVSTRAQVQKLRFPTQTKEGIW
jgi:hypothetical protein